MSRIYKQPSLVSGMSIQDILDMDINTFVSLNTSDLRKVVGRLVSAGNKRLRSFERAGESSPATREVEKSGGVFSTKGKTLNELRAEYTRAKNFLQAKTSTRRGWSQTRKEVIAGLKKQGIDVSVDQYNEMWRTYEELKELSPEVANRGLKYSVLKDVADMLLTPRDAAKDIITALRDRLSSIYEEREELSNGLEGVSDFFELE